MRLAWLLLSIGLTSTAYAQDDAAAGRTAALGWVRLPGAESCPSAQVIAQATDALLGRDAFVPAAGASMSIEGRAEPREGGFRATLVVSDASGAAIGERVVEADGPCDALLSPLSIVLAILVDPDATPVTPPDPSDGPPDPPPDPIVVTQVVTERVEVPVVVPAPTWRLVIDLGGVLSVGATPFVSGGGELALFLTPPGFVPIGAHGWIVPFSRAGYVVGTEGRWVDQLTAWLGLSICPVDAHDDTWSLVACAGLDVGFVAILSQSPTSSPNQRERVTGGIDLSLRGRVHVAGPLWATLSAALIVPFRGEAFDEGATRVPYYSPTPVALIVTLGPSFVFDL